MQHASQTLIGKIFYDNLDDIFDFYEETLDYLEDFEFSDLYNFSSPSA